MKNNLMKKLFGASKTRDKGATTLKKEKTLAKINETDAHSAKPRARPTVGLTEARLRAANQQSWISSSQGWSHLVGRFTHFSKR